jgi:hypothetical protein
LVQLDLIWRNVVGLCWARKFGYVTEPEQAIAELAGRLFDMARSGESATLAAYLDAGVPVNLTNGAGDTLVMLAAYHGHPGTVRALTDRGADVNRVNDRGQTPLAGEGGGGVVLFVSRPRAPPPPRASRRRSMPRGCSAVPATSNCSGLRGRPGNNGV